MNRGALSDAERERFGELIRHHRAYFVSIAAKQIRQVLKKRIDPEDVVQDTATKVMGAIPNHRHLLDHEEQFQRFFLTALQNQLKESSTRNGRQCRDANRERSLDDVSSTAMEPCTPSTRSPSRTLGREEAAQRLSREVEGLGDIDRQIVMGRAVDEKTYPELGRQVGLTGEAVRKRFQRIWDLFTPRVHQWFGLVKKAKHKSEGENEA